MAILKHLQAYCYKNNWFRQQYLRYHYHSRCDHCQGFTLTELTVTVIVIGILSAIALPSFVSRAQQAKEAEARMYVASINRSQQLYYLERGQFSSNAVSLGVGIPASTEHYSYQTQESNDPGSGTLAALTEATQINGRLRSFSGQVWVGISGSNSLTTSIFCEGATGAAPPAIVNHQCQ